MRLLYNVARIKTNLERERESETMGRSRKGVRFAVVENRIKVPGNVIYGIDLNPTFKPQAIIQSQSFSFLFLRLSALSTWRWFSLLHQFV